MSGCRTICSVEEFGKNAAVIAAPILAAPVATSVFTIILVARSTAIQHDAQRCDAFSTLSCCAGSENCCTGGTFTLAKR